jgi:hypothetical protein
LSRRASWRPRTLPRVIRPFDNGYFSEFGTFGITDRASDTPADLHRKILGCRRRPSRHCQDATFTSSKDRCPPRPEDLEILLTLNNRIYESISLTAWIGDNPPALLTAISACPKACLPAFPKQERAMP